MANETNLRSVTKKAAADISSYQFYAVRLTADNTVNTCNGYLYRPTGVLRNKPAAAGRPAEVCRSGECQVYLAGTVSAGDRIMPNASGAWIKATAGLRAWGEMQEGGSAGEIRTASIFCEGGGESMDSVISP